MTDNDRKQIEAAVCLAPHICDASEIATKTLHEWRQFDRIALLWPDIAAKVIEAAQAVPPGAPGAWVLYEAADMVRRAQEAGE